MGLGSLLDRVIPTAVGFATGGPVGATVGLFGAEKQKQEQKKITRAINAQQAKEREYLMMNYPSGFDPVTGNISMIKPTSQQAGFGAGFGSFLSEATRNIVNPIGGFLGGLSSIFGGGRPTSSVQQPAITSVTNVGAQESQGSGSIQAGFGSLIPNLINTGRSLITSPTGQIGLGTAIGGALSLLDSTGKQIRITRKTKRLAQQAYQLSMGDLSSATALFAQLSGIGVNEMQFVQILTKRFRNDGPVITKAAVRKTRSTLRKMKSMCDMYNSVAKAPARRRASPMKRATTTLIKN